MLNGSCASTKNIRNIILATRRRCFSCLKRFFGYKFLAPDASNELIGLKWSFWVGRDLVKILDLASFGKKSYGPSNMTLWPEKSEIFENFENYFFEFSQKHKQRYTTAIWSHLLSLMTIWNQSEVEKMKKGEKIIIFKNNFWPLGGVKSKFW